MRCFQKGHYPFLLDGVCRGSNGLMGRRRLLVESDSLQGQVDGVEGTVGAWAVDSGLFLLWSRGIVGSEHQDSGM